MSKRRYKEDPQKGRGRVQIYDKDTSQVSTIPADELAPGMVYANVSGVKGGVWISPQGLQKGPHRITPFDEPCRDFLRQIKAALDEVYPMSLEDWEDGFRRDVNCEREIAVWLRIAEVYTRFAAEHRSLAERHDIFNVLLACSTSPPDQVQHVMKTGGLTRARAVEIASAFYGKPVRGE